MFFACCLVSEKAFFAPRFGKMLYILGMKRFLIVFLMFVTAIAVSFANGTPEEQQAFFDNLMRNAQEQSNSNGYVQSQNPQATMGSDIISRDMASLERLYQYVNKNFLYDIDYDAVYEAMATAMFDALGDKYTYYVGEDDSEEYAEEISGKYGGLGIYFSKTYLEYQDPTDESTIYCNITQVFPNTPSSKAGFIAGDMITHIDGEPVDEMSANECAAKMKGNPGTNVDITIKRKGTSFTLTLTREVITVPTVEYEMIDDSIAYLRILQFSNGTYTAIKNALNDLSEKGMKGIIIDLRDNPGGDVDVTLSIADMFISDSKLLSINYKDTSKNIIYKANKATLVDPSVNVAILINEGTASSAEILSSTMRDNGRAVLFGATSYGKGVMQVISSFGEGYTSITTASFVPPSGNEIHKEGVHPDYEIETLVVKDEELDAYKELLNGKETAEFVEQNPGYNDENVAKYVQQFAQTGLRTEILQILVRNEYLANMTEEEKPLSDVKYDSVCKAAYEYLMEL